MKFTNLITKLLMITFCSFIITSCQTEKVTEIPAGFSLKWKSGPTHADRGAHSFIHITKSADGYKLTKGETFKFYSKEDGQLKDKTDINTDKDLSNEQVLQLYQLIIDEEILSMKERYRDPDIMDGDYKSLKIEWDGNKKTISAVNVTPSEFKILYKKLNSL